MKKVKALIIIPIIFLTGCIGGGGGGFDTVAFTKNPIVILVIGLIVLIYAFKSTSKH